MLTEYSNQNEICGLLKQRKQFVKLSRCSESEGLWAWTVIILAAMLLDFTINLLISLLT